MPFIPVYLLQVADAHVNSFSDFWWGGAYFTIDSPFGSTVFVNYPSPLLWVGYALYYTVLQPFTDKHREKCSKSWL
ncbi:MAG: hypothetical protein R3C26_22965 [Calditrichia bacterium]